MRFWETLKNAGLQTAATLGAGIFALPYVVYRAGWPVGLFYILGLGFLIVLAHTLYFRVFRAVGKKESLLGFARLRFGKLGFILGLLGVTGGLALTLAAYLVLGGEFLHALMPAVSAVPLPFVFWGVAALLLLVKRREFVKIELFGLAAIILLVLLIVFVSFACPPKFCVSKTLAGEGGEAQASLGTVSFFFPFGPIFFSLAGWTAVEPIYESLRSKNFSIKEIPVFALGTGTVAALYIVFVLGVFRIAPSITPNIVLGLGGDFWPAVFSVLGLFTLLVSYEPISLEATRALRYDVRLGKSAALALTIFLPPLLMLLGLNNFLTLLGFIGGVMLSLQYFLIISVARKILNVRGWKALLLGLVEVVFLAAAVYSAAQFFSLN